MSFSCLATQNILFEFSISANSTQWLCLAVVYAGAPSSDLQADWYDASAGEFAVDQSEFSVLHAKHFRVFAEGIRLPDTRVGVALPG
jgi:hypothetical protein